MRMLLREHMHLDLNKREPAFLSACYCTDKMKRECNTLKYQKGPVR